MSFEDEISAAEKRAADQRERERQAADLAARRQADVEADVRRREEGVRVTVNEALPRFRSLAADASNTFAWFVPASRWKDVDHVDANNLRWRMAERKRCWVLGRLSTYEELGPRMGGYVPANKFTLLLESAVLLIDAHHLRDGMFVRGLARWEDSVSRYESTIPLQQALAEAYVSYRDTGGPAYPLT